MTHVTPDSLTMGELGRSLDKLHTDLRELSTRVVTSTEVAALAQGWQVALDAAERRADAALLAQQRAADLTHADHLRRIEVVEGWQTWALRIVVGLVLAGFVGAAIATSRAGAI